MPYVYWIQDCNYMHNFVANYDVAVTKELANYDSYLSIWMPKF